MAQTETLNSIKLFNMIKRRLALHFAFDFIYDDLNV